MIHSVKLDANANDNLFFAFVARDVRLALIAAALERESLLVMVKVHSVLVIKFVGKPPKILKEIVLLLHLITC